MSGEQESFRGVCDVDELGEAGVHECPTGRCAESGIRPDAVKVVIGARIHSPGRDVTVALLRSLALCALCCRDDPMAGGAQQFEVGLVMCATWSVARAYKRRDVVDLGATLAAIDALPAATTSRGSPGSGPEVLPLECASALVGAVDATTTFWNRLVAPLAIAIDAGPHREGTRQAQLLHASTIPAARCRDCETRLGHARAMKTVFNGAHTQHHGVELNDGVVMACFEEPQRAEFVLQQVKTSGLGEIVEGLSYDISNYSAVHSERYVEFLSQAWDAWVASGFDNPALPLVWPRAGLRSDVEPQHIEGRLGFFAMDGGCSIGEGTWNAAQGSADTALTAVDLVLGGERAAFALCRPPGHHAARAFMGGYCYLNNAAIAVQRAIADGMGRVAVLDVDFHHGNGTQEIFYDRSDVFFASLHGDPRVSYPYFLGHADECGSGEGDGFNANYPLPPGTAWIEYSAALDSATARLRAHAPELLVVSLGVDTFEGDPISTFKLRSEDYLEMGRTIAAVGAPTLFVLEGGYAVEEIGINAVNVLLGFESA